MRKKKILFILPYLWCGGVESTFLTLINEFDFNKADVTLLLLKNEGVFSERVPKDVKIELIEVPEHERGVFLGKKNELKLLLKKGAIWKVPEFLLYNRHTTISENRVEMAAYFDRIKDDFRCLKEEYDIAIDFFGFATFTTFFLAEKVNAKVKVSWLHTIMSRLHPESFEKWYKKMDVIYACSKMVKDDFESVFPDIGTVALFYNIINPNLIVDRANEDGSIEGWETARINILTVGRISEEKGIDLAVEAYRKLISDGYPVAWYFVGGYQEKDKEILLEKCITPDEKENIHFLGMKQNPYIYMKKCDIYVQPSRFEGYCTATNEARIIGCPIVMTDVSGAREQIDDRLTGRIVESTSEEIYLAVKELIEHPELMKMYKNNLKNVNCDTRSEVGKLFELLKEKKYQ